MAKITQFNKHRPVDNSDMGFTVPGLKLRWVNGRVSENNPDRPWVVLRKSDLPKDLVDYIEGRSPDAFKGGETIRRGDLVLGYADEKANEIKKRELAEAAKEMQARVKTAPSIANKSGRQTAKVDVNEDKDVTQEILEQFKNSRK